MADGEVVAWIVEGTLPIAVGPVSDLWRSRRSNVEAHLISASSVMTAESPIIAFYTGTKPDHRGRYLREIESWSDDRLEFVHDYIQWLFPLPEPSGFNPAAPILTSGSVQEFRTRPDLQDALRLSFLRMLTFYGLELSSGEPLRVTRNCGFATKAAFWLSAGNHNHLRITRILKCLGLLGLGLEAKALFDCLADIYADEKSGPEPRISAETFAYWTEAGDDVGWQ